MQPREIINDHVLVNSAPKTQLLMNLKTRANVRVLETCVFGTHVISKTVSGELYIDGTIDPKTINSNGDFDMRFEKERFIVINYATRTTTIRSIDLILLAEIPCAGWITSLHPYIMVFKNDKNQLIFYNLHGEAIETISAQFICWNGNCAMLLIDGQIKSRDFSKIEIIKHTQTDPETVMDKLLVMKFPEQYSISFKYNANHPVPSKCVESMQEALMCVYMQVELAAENHHAGSKIIPKDICAGVSLTNSIPQLSTGPESATSVSSPNPVASVISIQKLLCNAIMYGLVVYDNTITTFARFKLEWDNEFITIPEHRAGFTNLQNIVNAVRLARQIREDFNKLALHAQIDGQKLIPLLFK